MNFAVADSHRSVLMKIFRPEELTSFSPIREYTEEEIKEAYALARAAFTIEDLLQYTQIHEDIPAEDILKEMEEAQNRHDEHKA
jgi:hypothetical protein